MPTTTTAATPSQTNPAPASENKPHEHLTIGAVRAAIWANQTQHGPMFTATFQRRWKDAGTGEWKTSTSYGRTELLQLAKLADRVHSRILILDNLERQAAQERDSGSSETESTQPSPRGGTATSVSRRPAPAVASGRATAKQSKQR
jgi:hypothetical protein